jgi:hypothetical protein
MCCSAGLSETLFLAIKGDGNDLEHLFQMRRMQGQGSARLHKWFKKHFKILS